MFRKSYDGVTSTMAAPLFQLQGKAFHGKGMAIRLASRLMGFKWQDNLWKDATRPEKFTEYWSGNAPFTQFLHGQGLVAGFQSDVLGVVGSREYLLTCGIDSILDLYPAGNGGNKKQRFDPQNAACAQIDGILRRMDDMAYQVVEPFFTEKVSDADLLPSFLSECEEYLTQNARLNGYLVGDGLTVADLSVFSMVSIFHPECKYLHATPGHIDFDAIPDECFRQYPRIYEHTQRIAEQETIREFIFFFNKMAKEFLDDDEEQERTIEYPSKKITITYQHNCK